MAGQVLLVPDPACQVTSAFPGVTFVGVPYCFAVTTRGTLAGNGYSGP